MKKKLLIVISDNFMYRNYIETSIFSLLNNKYKCSYIFDENIKNKNLLKYSSSFKFGYSKKKNDKYKNYYLSKFLRIYQIPQHNLATKIFYLTINGLIMRVKIFLNQLLYFQFVYY